MFEQLVNWIKQNYGDAKKIVEVGVGHRKEVAERISEALPRAEVLVTDTDESWVRSRRPGRIRAVADDVLLPNLNVYRGASLLYSLNPPSEIIPALEKLANRVGADLLLVPVSDEQHEVRQDKWQKLVVQGRTIGWLVNKSV